MGHVNVVLLTPKVTVVVHPIDTAVHVETPAGFRWAVMVGGRPPGDLDYCAHAGWCPTEAEALFEGESHGAVATRAARMFGVAAEYAVLVLDHDPIPRVADFRPLLNLR